MESSSAPAAVTFQPAGKIGFDVLADGRVVAPIRLCAGGVIVADEVQAADRGLRFSGLRCVDPEAASFGKDDFVSVAPGPADAPEPVVRFKLTLAKFDAARWEKLFDRAKTPFHFLICSMPSAKMWHQRGWLNATPDDDPFPLLGDIHAGSPEISCLWNRNWSYLCPLGAHPIPMIGLWDPESRLYVGYDFQQSRATDQSARYIATAYCWREGADQSFITLAYPYGGTRYGELVEPKAGQRLETRFQLIIDTNLPATEDPNERFQRRLFERYQNVLPAVPPMNDLAWLPGAGRLADFAGPIGLEFWGPGGEATFYPQETLMTYGWAGHREMPIDTAARQNDTNAIEGARRRLAVLLEKYGRHVKMNGEPCLFWEKPLEGSWRENWGGAGVTTLHNSDGWYPARALVELYRYDRARHQARAADLEAIDELFNWAKWGVWSRNEFPDVPSSPFAIGGSLKAAFLLDYYFSFKSDLARKGNAEMALRLADNVVWRYLPIWAMDSDRFDGGVDGSFLMEPNSGRDWAGLGCANETSWVIDSLTEVYVHTGDQRMRYYLRGILQRWPLLYRPFAEKSLADYGGDSLTEGYGVFDGSGPGRGQRYGYGFVAPLALEEPVGKSKLRVVAGARACIAFDKGSTDKDVIDYRTDGNGACSFRIVSPDAGAFDVSFTYPNVDVSRFPVTVNGHPCNENQAHRPAQAPSSLYLAGMRNGDVVTVGDLPGGLPATSFTTPRTYAERTDGAEERGPFTLLATPGEVALRQDWNDLHSFAGLVPGEHWIFGVPYRQGERAATNLISVESAGPSVLFAAYSANNGKAPRLVLSDGSEISLTGNPARAWRGWPPIFEQEILLDYAIAPRGARVKSLDPNGTLVMAVTVFNGDPNELAEATNALAAAAVGLEQEHRDRQALAVLRRRFEGLPAGKIAVLPGETAGPAATFAALAGLRDKWTRLSAEDFISADKFNASRFPIAFDLGDEHYVKTVRAEGDGKAALVRYLAEGGTLVLLASGPYPLYYGGQPGKESNQADPVLPLLGIPLSISLESAPGGLRMRRAAGQTVLRSVPAEFAFPAGDPRLRAGRASDDNAAERYVPLLTVVDSGGRALGDAAFYVELGGGPGKGGKVLYVWSTLQASPEGTAIMGDAVGRLLKSKFKMAGSP
jgi:hypothetical protein